MKDNINNNNGIKCNNNGIRCNNSRIMKIIELINELHLDAVVLSGSKNVFYFSGFYGDDTAVVITAEKYYIITDFRYYTQARKEAPSFELIDSKSGRFALVMAELICDNNSNAKSCINIGFEDSIMSASVYIEFCDRLRANKISFRMIAIDSELQQVRSVKDPEELRLIKKAAVMADNAFIELQPRIKPGVSELDLSMELEYLIKKQGSHGVAFDTIVVSGVRSCMPHGKASDRKLANGDAVTFDFGALCGGYRSDATRTIFIGYVDYELKKIYDIVLKAQEVALRKLKAGLTGIEADALARRVIEEEGYGKAFGHGLGHGVGLDIHESPRLSPRYEGILQSNSVVTVEPGIYIEGLGGVRIEDLVLINDTGVENLTGLNKHLTIY